MFGKITKQEPANAPKRKGAELMNQMGFGMPTNMEDMEAMVYGDDDDDDLEAELAALTGGESSPTKKSSPPKKVAAPVGKLDIEQMAAYDMMDLDEDVSDTEDPDLLAELAELDDNDNLQPTPTPPPPQRSPAPAPSPSNQQYPPAFSPTFSQAPQQSPQAPQRSPQASPGPSPSQASQGGEAVTVVQDRMVMYQSALQNAKQLGDSSKARRLDRGLKTLTDTLRKAKAGKPITDEDMPPPVAMGTSTIAPAPGPSSSVSTPSPTHAPSSSSVDGPGPSVLPPAQTGPSHTQPGPSTSSAPEGKMRHTLESRKEQYRHAALAAKQGGDMATASKYAKIAKQFDTVLHALEEGKPIDLSNMPPPLPGVPAAASQTARQPVPEVRVQRSTNQGAGGKDAQPEEPSELPPEPTEEEAKKLFQAPDAPKTVMEALTQRLEKYKSTENSAKEAGESGKARRMGRIVKQYESAVKDYRAGKPVDFLELPTPPGFGPIPVSSGPPPRASPSPQKPQQTPQSASPAAAGAARALVSPPQPAPRTQAPSPQSTAGAAAGAHAKTAISRAATTRKSGHSRQEQQLGFLQERMEEFRTAALQAKKNKDLEMAKQHIRMMKGMEPMIEALEAGLPVDLAQVPPSPLANDENEDKFIVVSAEDCQPSGDRDEVFTQLEQDLAKQIQICNTNAQHFTKMGDVPGAAKFQKMGQGCAKDLESLKSSRRHGDPLPKFHYETRSFSIVQSNTELGENEMELTVVRGISYNLPSGYSEKDMDTMVKYEFAFPSEESQTGHTSTVKDTINPEYNESFKLQIDRKSRSFARFIERKGIKLDIYHKRGFFKGDKLLGSVTVKLTPLETKCILHDSFDLMDGRKSVGGKLEVKVRLRDPFKGRQVEESKEKWLVIDQFIRTVGSKSQAGQTASAQKPKNSDRDESDVDGTSCMEVLRYEKQQLDKQISYLKDSLSAIQMQTLRHKSSLLEEKLELQQKQLREGGTEAWKAYVAAVEKEAVMFETEARQLARIGDVQKAETMINKCKLAKKELAAIKAKIPG
ncbi:coiled-coil and C2 domain-containing protein 1-like isoform X1 [Littorina saxatilis]|uniref:coiled-coil and C2 domain-containing protein 1-like isoform X1 n=1 Tax=Littorina saxatilis TaxID=31220 RepID=UPI0038B4A981